MDLVPHGMCLSSEPWIVAGIVIADGIIFLSYVSIPLSLQKLVEALEPPRELVVFAGWFQAFIVMCGLSHATMIYTMYFGDVAYVIQLAVLWITAIISAITVGLLRVRLHLMLRLIGNLNHA